MNMCVENTPVTYHPELGLYVKHEELCNPDGPPFSKARGVYAHLAKRKEKVIGVLDTSHSQGGWAVAQACKLLGKKCIEFFPVPKANPFWIGEVQRKCLELNASAIPLPAGRSAVLYHAAKKRLPVGGYMMPNALKLPESVYETALEVERTKLPKVDTVLVSASSGTIAAGVNLGLRYNTMEDRYWNSTVIVHLGYSRPERAVQEYLGLWMPYGAWGKICIVDEGYAYKDKAKDGPLPPFACNDYYDLKAFRWWMAEGRAKYKRALMWNIG